MYSTIIQTFFWKNLNDTNMGYMRNILKKKMFNIFDCETGLTLGVAEKSTKYI